MITTNLSGLKINKLTKAQYEAAKAAGNLSEQELYMTPSEAATVDLSNIPTPTTDTAAANKKYVDDKVAAIPAGPTITYGTTALIAGTSELQEGTFYFVYE